MKICTNPSDSIEKRPRGVALGTFDGVHLGHEELLRELVMTCRSRGLLPAVFTFSTHPEQVFSSGFRGYLMDEADRLRVFKALGVEEVFIFPLESVCRLPAEDFLAEWMENRLDAKIIFVGRDASFGAGRTGGTTCLVDWSRRSGREARIVHDVNFDGKKISSTRIREALAKGKIEDANSMLAHPYRLSGIVRSGRNLGRKLGIPTANFPMPDDRVAIPYGVYAGRAEVQGRVHDAIINIGRAPTVGSGTAYCRVEAHLLDFCADLYGCEMSVELLSFFRPEKKFADFEEMLSQIAVDKERARSFFSALEDPVCRFTVGGVPAVFTSSSRFSTATAVLMFRRRPNASRLTDFSLLMRLLASTNADYEAPSQLLTCCTNLYGAVLYPYVNKQGDVQICGLMLTCLQEKDGVRALEEALKLMFDCLLRPLRDGEGRLDEAGIIREKAQLEAELSARYEDRQLRAIEESLFRLFPGSDHGKLADGDREALKDLTACELERAYGELWTDCQISFYYAGQTDDRLFDAVEAQLARLPEAKGRPAIFDTWPLPLKPEPIAPFIRREVTTQAQVIVQISAAAPWYSVERFAQSLFVAVLGGDERSCLFAQVRERQGLAYQVYAFNLLFSGVTILYAGTAPESAQAAKEAILDELRRLSSEGGVSQNRLKVAKKNLQEKVRRSADAVANLLRAGIYRHIYGHAASVEERVLLLEETELEDIKAAAERSTLLSTYMLLPPENE
jgi:riboflavin kinase/FMN adenylyltransferase